MPMTRVEVTPRQGEGMRDVRGDVVRRQLAADHNIHVPEVRSVYGFLVNGETPPETIAARIDDLFADPIIEQGAVTSCSPSELLFIYSCYIISGYLETDLYLQHPQNMV